MNRRVIFFAVIEAVILLFLLMSLLKNVFILFLALAVFFSWLATQFKSRIIAVCSAVIWIITAVYLLKSVYFWLAIAFPIVLIILMHYRKNPSNGQAHYGQFYQNSYVKSPEQNINENKNEIIDLADLHFHESGNNLAIRKNSGNTKIIVPEDVEVALNVNVRKGVVNVLGKMTEINDVQLRYFSDNYEAASKRVAIMIKVDEGNVEIIRDH